MYNTNSTVDQEVAPKERILNDIDPTGIWKGLILKEVKFDDAKNYVYFKFYHPETDSYRREAFFEPKSDLTEKKKAYDLSVFEDFVKAFVPPVIDGVTGKDIRFGTESMQVSTFKDFVLFYTSRIDLEKIVPVDLKGLWAKKSIVADPEKPYARPRIDRGNKPFINSAYFPNTLSVMNEINDTSYPKFLTYTVEGLTQVNTADNITDGFTKPDGFPF